MSTPEVTPEVSPNMGQIPPEMAPPKSRARAKGETSGFGGSIPPEAPPEDGAFRFARPHFGGSLDTGAQVRGGEPQKDPALRFADPRIRAEAFDRWMHDGQPWPPPAGLASACAARALGHEEQRRAIDQRLADRAARRAEQAAQGRLW